MLILLPASESKTEIRRGNPLDLDGLSFPPLAPTRAAVLDALIEVSAEPDATDRVCVPATMRDVVRRNITLCEAPTARAEAVYSGVLYDALALKDLEAAARRRARAWIVIISALWGAVRPGDRIPSYRLNMCGRLPGLAHLPQVWRQPLADVLGAPARRRRRRLPAGRVRHRLAADRGVGRANRDREGAPQPGEQARSRGSQRQAHPRAARPPDRHRRRRPGFARRAGRRRCRSTSRWSWFSRTARDGCGGWTSSNPSPDSAAVAGTRVPAATPSGAGEHATLGASSSSTATT